MKTELLNKKFIGTKDLMEITGMGIHKCENILREIKQEMKEKNMYVPYDRKLMLPTKYVREKLGI